MNVELITLATSLPGEVVHMHDEWELCYCIDGDGECVLGDTTYPFPAGSFYICPPNLLHARIVGENRSRDLYMRLTGDVVPSGIKSYLFSDDVDCTVRSMLTLAYRLYNNDTYSDRCAVCHLTEAIVAVAIGGSGQERLSESVATLRDEIYKNFADPEYKVARSIGNLGYNPDYMRRLFKEEMGVTPSDLLTIKRVENAKTLLASRRTPELTIAEIAYISGFYDFNYFTRVFKKVTGTLPTAYRKAARNRS